MTETDQDVYDAVGTDTSISEIAAQLEISDDMAFRSMRKLESMYLVTRTDVNGNNKWSFSKVTYPEVERNAAIDRIVLRFLECFAPATVQEVSFALSLTEDEARSSLESLTAAEEVSKGRFLVSENDQYMLRIDHMRLKAGRNNVYDYDSVERYWMSKGEHFDSIRDFFRFYGTAGSELDVYNRVDGFDIEEWNKMRESGEILLGRFVRGKVRFILSEDADRYAALRHEDVNAQDLAVLNMIDGMGRATLRQLVAETGLEKDVVKDSVMRLDRSLRVIRDFDEKEDWGTENTYAVFRPGEAEGEPAKDLLVQAIRAYGPIPATALRFIVDIPLDDIERLATEAGAVTISVGEGHTSMFVMPDEIPDLERVPEVTHPIRVLSLYDPDLGSKWAEISSRYGDKWIYPLVRGNMVVGALEMWSMSGCVEIRAMDMDSPDLLGEVLDAIDRMMGFYRMRGVDIVRIREILNKDVADIDDVMVSTLKDHGYHMINGFYAKGDFVPWTMSGNEFLSYVFNKQKVGKDSKYPTATAAITQRGYIRGDQELLTRVAERTTMKKQMEKGYTMKMVLSPPFQGYTDFDHAYLFRAEKAYVPDSVARDIISMIKDRQPISKKDIIEHSTYGPDRTSDALSDLSRNSVVYQDSDSNYNLVQLKDMDPYDAMLEIAKMHFRDFGVFSAENLSSFVAGRMSTVRKILRDLEAEGFVKKGFFLRDDPTLRWMLSEDVGKGSNRFLGSFVLNSQDNLHVYMRDHIKREVGSTKSVIISGTKIVGSFKGKVCSSGAKVEEFEGTDRADRILREAAQSVGMRLDSERQREDEDWDVSEFYIKVNPGA